MEVPWMFLHQRNLMPEPSSALPFQTILAHSAHQIVFQLPAGVPLYLGKLGKGGPEKMDAAGRPAKLMRFTAAGPTSLPSFDLEDRELGLALLGED